MHQPITQADLLPATPFQRLGRHLVLLDQADSTNTWLLARAERLGDGAVVLAEYQTAGRGRLGRSWLAPRGSSILMSVLLIEPPESALLPLATAAASLAAVAAVERETTCIPRLRWPNDIVARGRKLGGVLAESRPVASAGATARALVVGIGLNCYQQTAHFAGELAHRATSLEIECREPVSRAALARCLLGDLDARLADATTPGGPERLMRDWAARCDDIATRVTLRENGRLYTGTVLDVVDNGDLLVQLDQGGRRRFESTTTTRIP